MSEKPILFSGEMVRAILDGRKTQTRRIVTRNNSTVLGTTSKQYWDELVWNGTEYMDNSEFMAGVPNCQYLHVPAVCEGESVWYRVRPRIVPGDSLWVRETWGDRADYAAIGKMHKDRIYYAADGRKDGWKYRPSIHMPRWACRLRLKVTGVRVERLQDISQEDAIAEGSPRSHSSIDGVSRNFGFPDFSRSWFAQLWQSINGPESWAENPWVWVYEFERKEEVLG